jgi:sirohydrochlorin cobaltochelatase
MSTFDEIDERLKTILPEEYQDAYEDVQPVSMGSAPVKYGADGAVAWDEMWATFCDLAMAGGPPHKGMLLLPAAPADIEAAPDRYGEVVDEICRGIIMVTELDARAAPHPGWVRVRCWSDAMAGWLLRAITMENIAVRCEGHLLFLPAGPAYRVEKEIKNVITAIAKTCHYWTGHMWRFQRQAIAELFATLARETPLVQPAWPAGPDDVEGLERHAAGMAEALRADVGLSRSTHTYSGWLGLECASVRAAVWMMRTLVGTNVLSRREGTTLFVPVNPAGDPEGAIIVSAVTHVHGLARTKGLFNGSREH